jgi:5'-3' exonuclease
MDSSRTVLFIDLSYYIFYRWFAIYNWYKLSQQKEPDIDQIFENTDNLFLNKFDKLFWETIAKFIKKHKIINPNIIFAKDCSRKNIWRNQHHGNYKAGRDDKLKNFKVEIFNHVYNNILPNLVETNSNIQILYTETAEADDIIGVLKNKIRIENPLLNIFIIANDHDFLQLLDDNTYLINLKGYDLKKKSVGNPSQDLLLKIIKGDVSDNIDSIFGRKVTDKFAMKYVLDDELLNSFLEKNEEAKKKFENNKLLIDFTQIPETLKNNIEILIN